MSGTEPAHAAADPPRQAPDEASAPQRPAENGKEFVQVHSATVRFAGDSGDGMQVVGSQFADIASMTGRPSAPSPTTPRRSVRRPARWRA